MLLAGLNRTYASSLPEDFIAETDTAQKTVDLGHLRLLSQEARLFHWATQGLKKVGDAQFDRGDMNGTSDTLEYLLSINPGDTEVNLRLGTLYRRLKEPRKSDQAVQRALEKLEPGSKDWAEAFVLLGGNSKVSWIEAWRSHNQDEWPQEALRSSGLLEAYE